MGLLHSESCRMAYTCYSAFADLGDVNRLGRQCAVHLPFNWLQVVLAGAIQSLHFEFPTDDVSPFADCTD